MLASRSEEVIKFVNRECDRCIIIPCQSSTSRALFEANKN